MGSARGHLRVRIESSCILCYEDVNYHVLLENISLGGALVKLEHKKPDSLYIGAKVDLMLCSNPDLCPTKYSCKVTRIESESVGINFLSLKL